MKTKNKGRMWKWGLFYSVVSIGIIAGILVFVTHAAELKGPDYWPTDDWRTTTPEQQGMKSEVLAGLFDQVQGTHLHSLVITRNGYLVAEAYNEDLDKNSKQHVFSATKSITSALTGIAINEGKLNGVTQTVSSIFPDWPAFQNNDQKKEVTIGELLTMTSAIKWDNTNEKSTNEMMSTSIWPQFFINQPMDGAPGSKFMYSNGSAVMMSAILQHVLGEPTSQYADEKLFQPLGIKDVGWPEDPSGITIGAWGVHLTTREMAKFGFLYLNNGTWAGKQIVPKSWVKESIVPLMNQEDPNGNKLGYGYFWWTRAINKKDDVTSAQNEIYSAIGSGGQRIAVVPKYNLVVSFTANNQGDAFFTDNFIDNYIIPSIVSNKPIKDNPDGQALLNQKIADFKKTSDPVPNAASTSFAPSIMK